MTEAPPSPEIMDDSSEGFDVQRTVVIAVSVLIGLFALLLVLAIAGAVLNVERFGPIIEIIRDIVLIFLALEGILIILALAILIAQVARLVNLLQNEVGPVFEDTQQTVKHARGTVEFVGNNVSEPIIKANAFAAGVAVFIQETFKLRAALRSDDVETNPTEQEKPGNG
ncbi:MAG: hypothetical protein AAF787_22500 [Chloroflexota bacterium]